MAKGLLAILGKPKTEGEEPEGPEDMGMSAKKVAAKDLVAAVKAGDADSVADAFQRMYDACASGGGEEMGEEY